MASMIPFDYQEQLIRTITEEDGSIWFVAKEICDVYNGPQFSNQWLSYFSCDIV